MSTKGGVSYRTEKWRYTEWDGSIGKGKGKGTGKKEKEFELYDLENDAGEFTNVAQDPAYREIREKLAVELSKRKRAAGYAP